MLVNEMHQGGILALIDYDSTLFDNMALPEDEDGNQVATIQDIVDHILFKYGNCPLFCPDPAVMKYYITSWSNRRVSIWERFYAAITTEYNPLENYDRHEKADDDFSPGATYEQQISADNATTYQADRKSIGSGKDQRDFESHIHGNIGVTTSQQMLQAEMDIAPKLDLIDFIADDWHAEFNLMIY